MNTKKLFGGMPKRMWYHTFILARAHSMMWVLMTPLMWFFVWSTTTIYLHRGFGWGVVIFGCMSLISAYANFEGTRAIWNCKRLGIDYNKSWDTI